MGASALPLPALEIAIRRGSAALAWLQAIGIHGQAHGAAWLAPPKAGILEDLVQPFLFRLPVHQPGAWHHERQLDALGLASALDDGCCRAQILDAAIGA